MNGVLASTVVATFSGSTITFNNSFGFTVGDALTFESINIDLSSGWYYYVDTTNLSQTDPWGHMIANSGAPVTGGVIPVPSGGVSSGTSCDSWKRFVGTEAQAQTQWLNGQCIPTLFTFTITQNFILNPDPVNFTFEYVSGVYPV